MKVLSFTGKDDIFYVMIAQGLAVPAIIVLGANIWTTNNNECISMHMAPSILPVAGSFTGHPFVATRLNRLRGETSQAI